jgi:hypothetical protein
MYLSPMQIEANENNSLSADHQMLRAIHSVASPATSASFVARLCNARQLALSPRRLFQTLVQLQQNACVKFAERPFLGTRVQGQSKFEWMSYKQIACDIDFAKQMLQQEGVGKGSVVAIIANNRKEWVIAAYAAFALGARFVPMYEAMPLKDWVYILNDCKASVLFAAKIVAEKTSSEKAPDVKTQVASLKSVILLDAPSGSPDSFASALGRGAAANLAAAQAPAPAVLPSDIATIIYTSGTTGKPKGVCLSHDNIVSNVNAIASLLKDDNYSTFDRHSSFLPWAHIYGNRVTSSSALTNKFSTVSICFSSHPYALSSHWPCNLTSPAGQTVELHHSVSRGVGLGLTSSVTLLEDLPLIQPSVLISVSQIVFGSQHAVTHALHSGAYSLQQNIQRDQSQREVFFTAQAKSF